MNLKITRFAEFQDKEIEANFFNNDVKKASNFISYTTIIFSIINFLFVIYDYLFLQDGSMDRIINYSLIPTFIILVFASMLFIIIKKTNCYKLTMTLTSLFIIMVYAAHLYSVVHFTIINLTFEVLDVILVILCVYLIPNRWIINFVLSILTCLLFLIISPMVIPGITAVIEIELIPYLFWLTAIISMLIFIINKNKRIQYSKELQLEELLKTDPLTKAYSRMAFDNIMMQMCKAEMDFSVILFDIDNFKNINDSYGHMIGDEVLVRISKTVGDNIRKEDLLVRWGGEEFIVLLFQTALNLAVERAEHIRQLISSTTIENVSCRVTASFGVTASIKGDSLHSIMKRADDLLYAAKANGKNKVIYS